MNADHGGRGEPDLIGKTAIVTGANSGLGFAAAHALAGRGARVILACRDPERGERALNTIAMDWRQADVRLELLDLAELQSVDDFARRVLEQEPRVDILLNNAGVMALPRGLTKDGFERQLGINHLGHFALTGLLLPRLSETNGARVVTVSSLMHRTGRMRLDDPMGERRYGKWAAYAQSKLANLLFAFELHRRCRQHRLPLASVAAHPGYAATNLQTAGPRMTGARLSEWTMQAGNWLLAQDAHAGALPLLHAATAPEVQSGDFFGPAFLELRGGAKRVTASARARNRKTAAALWDMSEQLTGVRYDELD